MIPPVQKTFNFPPDQPGAPRLVRRKVTIVVPPQTVRGSKHQIKVAALPLPADPPTLPAKGSDTVRLITGVVFPEMRSEQTNEVVTTFDAPVMVTIDFNSADAAAAPRGKDGKPQLSIITYYEDGGVWRWERLQTTVTCTGNCDQGTLTAKLLTLNPKDPLGLGFP